VAARWPIVLGWVAAVVLATTSLPSIAESQNGALGDLVPNDAAAIETELRANELFGFPVLSRNVVVQRDADGLGLAAQRATVARAVALDRHDLPRLRRVGGAIPLLNQVPLAAFTRESGTTALTYLFFAPGVGSLCAP
jgi:putative drug exporter of the RND superfamily